MEPPVPSVRPVSVNRKVYGRRSTLFPACLDMGWPEPNRFEIVEVTGGALIVLEGHWIECVWIHPFRDLLFSHRVGVSRVAAEVISTGFSTAFPAAVR